jgi:maleylpyruvate isomerase
MIDPLDAARQALRARQGEGARYDAPSAPARELDWARRGTAYFLRLLNGLADDVLDAPSRIPGLSRRRLVAHAGYHARLLGEIIAWGRAGRREPFPRAATVTAEELDFGEIQPPHALRYLFEHAAVHLNVEWRDMTDEDWDRVVEDGDGRRVALSDTALERARLLWAGAFALDAGGRDADLPRDFPRNLEFPASL